MSWLEGRSARPDTAELEAELAFHVARLEEELRAAGLEAGDAAAEARRRFGDPDRWRDACLAEWEESMSSVKAKRIAKWSALVGLMLICVWNVLRAQAVTQQLRAAMNEQEVLRSELQERIREMEKSMQDRPPTGKSAPEGSEPELLATTLAQLLELNRSGRWREAADLAERMLASAEGDRVPTDRAEVLLSLAYARHRIGDAEGSRAAFARFDELTPQVPVSHWVHGYAGRLRAELGGAAAEGSSAAEPDAFWESADPAALGLDASVVEEHRALCEETGADSALVVYRGRIVSEWTGPRFELPVYAMSSTKSITSLLVGCLIDDGLLESIDVPVGRFLPDWTEGARGRVTLRHLLSHTSGMPKLKDESVGFVDDKNTFARNVELTSEPGTTFAYSNEGVQLLSPILDLAAGEPLQEYARRRLFEPLGMRDSRFQLDGEKHAWTYADLITTPRDLARIGLLMLQGGTWEGERVVSQAWVEESTRPSQEFRDDCGLLWWIHEEPAGFAALGYLHTDVHVFPGLELVVVRTQSRVRPDAAYPDYRERALPLFQRMVGSARAR